MKRQKWVKRIAMIIALILAVVMALSLILPYLGL